MRTIALYLTALLILISPLAAKETQSPGAKTPQVLMPEPENSTLAPARTDTPEVWDIFGDFAVRGRKVHLTSLRSMLDTGLMAVTNTSDPNQAWQTLLQQEDIIAFKFNPVGAEVLATDWAIAQVMVESLEKAGWGRGQIMIVGLVGGVGLDGKGLNGGAKLAGTRPCPYGWQKELVDFGSDRDHLALWLQEVTAIINVAAVLDDNVLGIRGALANATLGAVKQPARLYLNGGDPFVCDIYAHPAVRCKVRLHVVNALRILAYGGPIAEERYVYEYGSLLLSRDPVALDTVAVHLLYRARRFVVLPDEVDEVIVVPYLLTAQALGLGQSDLNRIAYHRCRHGTAPRGGESSRTGEQ